MNIHQVVRTVKYADKFRRANVIANKAYKPIAIVSHKYGPEILTGVGIVGGLGTIVLASKATLQLEEIVDQTKAAIEYAETSKDAAKYRAQGILAIAKLYAPAASLGLASTAAILGAHGVMKRRNVALAAAYKAIETSFAEYRKRVVDELGVEKEQDIRYGLEDKSRTNHETGEVKVKTHVNPNGISQYAKFFDENSSEWSKQPEYNLFKLKCQQQWANDILLSRGHIFLNEVYDSLGIPKTQQGQVVGWVLGGDGDNFVDFGVYNFDSQKARDFVNGYEKSILLDFNVNGYIVDRIGEKF